MMECWVSRGDGSMLTLPRVLEWDFRYGTGTPCDSFRVRCLWEGGRERELSAACRFYAQWKGERVFTGVVDEFTCSCGKDGTVLEMEGRGMAALLLDNEALPAVYQRMTCADLVKDHVAPYGIKAAGGDQLPAVSDFTVESGSSEWSAVWNYACGYGGVVPRFDRMGTLILEPHRDDSVVTLGGEGAILGWEYREQRHGVLSAVAVRRRTQSGLCWVEDEQFKAEGGCARRVLSVPNTTGTADMRWSGDYQLKASRRERVWLTMTLAGAFAAFPGQLAQVTQSGIAGRYRVARSRVRCDGDGLTTTLELAAPDAMI